MAHTAHYHTKFETGDFYHVYNRTVDRKPMFKNDGNYRYFLKQYDHYLTGVVDTYAYCLLGNHFHLLVRVRSEEELSTFQKLTTLKKNEPGQDLTTTEQQDLTTYEKLSNQKLSNLSNRTAHQVVSHQFRKFFQSYAMAFNKQQDRTGTLFQTPFKRAVVDTEQYLLQLVYYIHANPQTHGLTDDFRDWIWSSYSSVLADKPSKLKKQEVINWFGNADGYKEFHSVNQKIIYNEKYILEDE